MDIPKKIDQAAIEGIFKGNNLTRPSLIELKAAELITSLIKSADMVKFTKNGSTAVTAAVKLARAYTGKKIILRCADHPFFSYDDWFIGSTKVPRGVTNETRKLTKQFKYNNIESLKNKYKNTNQKLHVLCWNRQAQHVPKLIIRQAAVINQNVTEILRKKNHFLKRVQKLCKKNNIIFILDEMITGFRWDLKGAQNFYNIKPDLSTFGKAMANGFSVAAICGNRKIMELGSITNKKQEKVFLLSTTHGAEMNGLSAFIETVKYLKKKKVIKKNWEYGEALIQGANKIAEKLNIKKYFYFSGIACSPIYNCLDKDNKPSLEFRTLFIQEMLKHKILMPWVSISYRHNSLTLKKTLLALEKTLKVYKKALEFGPKKYIKGHIIKPVFRKFN